jgi:hypothetical protein
MTGDAKAAKRSVPSPPSSLSRHGKAFWRRTFKEWQLSGSEREVLAEALHLLDRARECRETVRAEGAVVRGSRGSVREHPAAALELRYARLGCALLLQLGLVPPEHDAKPRVRGRKKPGPKPLVRGAASIAPGGDYEAG